MTRMWKTEMVKSVVVLKKPGWPGHDPFFSPESGFGPLQETTFAKISGANLRLEPKTTLNHWKQHSDVCPSWKSLPIRCHKILPNPKRCGADLRECKDCFIIPHNILWVGLLPSCLCLTCNWDKAGSFPHFSLTTFWETLRPRDNSRFCNQIPEPSISYVSHNISGKRMISGKILHFQ